jgi:paraquat-inducible protein B
MNKANPGVIGGFVVGAIALVVIGLLVFGSTNWFTQRNTYVAYFPGSVKGLQVGAPVDFRGVTIGQVTDLKVQFDPEDISARIPVVMEYDPSRIEVVGVDRTSSYEDDLQRLVDAGFRAQLQPQSLLTGLLFINLDFHKDAPVRLVGGDQPYPEIPTIPSSMEEIQQTAGDIAQQLPGLITKLNGLLESIDEELKASSGGVQQIIASTAEIAKRLDEGGPMIGRILDNTEDATGDVRQAAATLDQILRTNGDAIGTLINEWTVTAGSVQRMADQINNMVADNRESLQTGLYEYTGLAQDAQQMVDQITRVTEELERDPARFLFGDQSQGISTE